MSLTIPNTRSLNAAAAGNEGDEVSSGVRLGPSFDAVGTVSSSWMGDGTWSDRLDLGRDREDEEAGMI